MNVVTMMIVVKTLFHGNSKKLCQAVMKSQEKERGKRCKGNNK